ANSESFTSTAVTYNETIHPNSNTFTVSAGPGIGVQYSYDLFPNVALGTGLGFGVIKESLAFVLDSENYIGTLDLPLFARFYPLTYRHRPFFTLGTVALIVAEDSRYNPFMKDVYGLLYGDVGYEFRGLKGFVFRGGIGANANFSDDLSGTFAPMLTLALGWSF
ncbi:MAG TPA: hypothetical protein VJL87_06390, partial [Bdellovibrionota bacterium]|nr:hypothetical protein [Bdellovibrionota bacterium]